MNITTRTATVHQHYIVIGAAEFPTLFQAEEYITPKVEITDNLASITYATHDDGAANPREMFDPVGTMVRVADGYNGVEIDEPDDEIAAAWTLAEDLNSVRWAGREVYFLQVCGCAMWGSHTLEEVLAGECRWPWDELVVGGDEDHYPDGSTNGLTMLHDYERELDSLEGAAAMLCKWEVGIADQETLVRAYLAVTRPDVTAFITWSISGSSQSDWATGYAYTSAQDLTDPEAVLEAEVAEYGYWANNEVYMAVDEEYELIDGEWVQQGYTACGGFYGDDHIEQAIKEGAF